MSNPTPQSPSPAPSGLPLVVQLGFAGARGLIDPQLHSGADPAAFELAVERRLAEELRGLPAELGVPLASFCGISQIAIGADTLFTRACRDLGIAQRIFLPQHRDAYLDAVGSTGPDFTAAQKQIALDLLASPHVIQERLVSDAAERHDRFHDVNLEIVRESDLLVCLTRAGQGDKPGGTEEVIALARKRGRPVLELRAGVRPDGAPDITRRWHGIENFRAPKLPPDLAAALPATGAGALPEVDVYSKALKELASREANWKRKLFARAATVLIGAHVIATLIAVTALKLHGAAVPRLLVGELVLLTLGFGVHRYLHRTHAVERWALFRLVAEVARSTAAIGRFHLHLEHLFTLPFPDALLPLLRTISVLHLRSTAAAREEPWQPKRDAYVTRRLVSVEVKAQIPYNRTTRDRNLSRLGTARRVFFASSLSAIAATSFKLLALYRLPDDHAWHDVVTAVLGALAVVLPVIAVGALSLAAALDLEAKHHTAKEMLEFLEAQKLLLENASSRREYSRLVIETESRLLGETVNWYARRSFVGVA